MSRLIRIALAVAAGVLVGVGVASASSPSTTSHATSHRSFRHHSFKTSFDRRFGLFGRARSATAKPLPANVAASFNEPSQASVNYNPDAQAAVYESPSSNGSPGFWIVPGEGGACVVWETTAITTIAHANCLKAAQVEKNGMTEITSTDGPTLVFGFRPNGATAVTITNTDGSRITAAVTGNAFAVVDPESAVQSIASQSGTGSAATTTAILPLHNN